MSSYRPPPYAYGLLDDLRVVADKHTGGAIDLSVGNPFDPPPPSAVTDVGSPWGEAGYPPSAGTEAFRRAAARWLHRRAGAHVDPVDVAACVGTKEFFGTLPWLLARRRPDRDTVLLPALGYPSYEHGAEFAGLRIVRVPLDHRWRLRLDAVEGSDVARALCLVACSPGNPTGASDDLDAVARWGRRHDVIVVSDECGSGLSWRSFDGTEVDHGRSILADLDDATGVLAVQSMSKWANFAAGRVGFYAGDPVLVEHLVAMRRHVGMMVPRAMQAAAAAVLDDDEGLAAIRATYHRRLSRLAALVGELGVDVALPDGGFFLWCAVPGGDAWEWAADLAESHGVVVAPGTLYGDGGEAQVRIGAVTDDAGLDRFEARMLR